MKTIISVALLSLSLSANAGMAQTFTPFGMTYLSTIVFVGKIIKTVETEKTPPCDEGIATIKIEQIIKGGYSNSEIDLNYCPGLAISPKPFPVGQRYVFFIRQANGFNILVHGFEGMVHIKGEQVYDEWERKYQDLEIFIQKIKDCEKRP